MIMGSQWDTRTVELEIVKYGDSETQGNGRKYINPYVYQIVRKYFVK